MSTIMYVIILISSKAFIYRRSNKDVQVSHPYRCLYDIIIKKKEVCWRLHLDVTSCFQVMLYWIIMQCRQNKEGRSIILMAFGFMKTIFYAFVLISSNTLSTVVLLFYMAVSITQFFVAFSSLSWLIWLKCLDIIIRLCDSIKLSKISYRYN